MNFFNISSNKIELNENNNFKLFFIVLIFLTLYMMFCNGLSSTYAGFDFYFHYQRLNSLIDALRVGAFPYYTDYTNIEGYGYFTKGFYSDVVLIPFALVGLFTNTFFAYDLMIFTMSVLCGVFTYHTVKVIYKSSFTAAIGAILYTFAVYRLYDIYQRGALGESLSFTFLPIVFLGLYYIIRGNYKKWYVLAIGYSLLLFTHLIASVLMFVTLIILLIIYYKQFVNEPKRGVYLILAGIVTTFIVSYYLFPMLEQITSNSFYFDSRSPGGGAGYGKAPYDLVFWGFISGIGYPDQLWCGVGIILTCVVLLRFFVKNNKTTALRNADIGVIIGLFYIIAISRIFPWGRFPFSLLGFIQYPWRLYEFVNWFFAIAGAYYISVIFLKNKQRTTTFAVIVIVTMLTIYISSENFKHLFPQTSSQNENSVSKEIPTYENGYHLIGREYLPSKLSDIYYIHERGEKVETKNKNTKILNLRRNNHVTLFDIKLSNKDTLSLPLLYYVGYKVTLNGDELNIMQGNEGLIEIAVNKSGNIEAYYEGTFVQKISFWVSIISILLLSIYILRKEKDFKNEIA